MLRSIVSQLIKIYFPPVILMPRRKSFFHHIYSAVPIARCWKLQTQKHAVTGVRLHKPTHRQTSFRFPKLIENYFFIIIFGEKHFCEHGMRIIKILVGESCWACRNCWLSKVNFAMFLIHSINIEIYVAIGREHY